MVRLTVTVVATDTAVILTGPMTVIAVLTDSAVPDGTYDCYSCING